MLTQMLESIPGPVKASADILTVAGWISVLAGALTQVAAAIAAVVSLIWWALRLWGMLTRRRHCTNAADGCPHLCPSACQHWRVKAKK